MSLVVLALLVGLWSAILLPGAIRARRAAKPRNSVEAFRKTMERLSTRTNLPEAEILAPSGGDDRARPAVSPRVRAMRRRQIVSAVLCGVGVVAATAGVTVAPALLWLLAADAIAAVGYVCLLIWVRSRAEEAGRKVLPLPARPPSDSPPPPAGTGAVALPRAAGEGG